MYIEHFLGGKITISEFKFQSIFSEFSLVHHRALLPDDVWHTRPSRSVTFKGQPMASEEAGGNSITLPP